MLKSFDLKTYKNTQVKETCKHIVNILLKEVLETLLTPVKYPEREVITELNGRLIAII